MTAFASAPITLSVVRLFGGTWFSEPAALHVRLIPLEFGLLNIRIDGVPGRAASAGLPAVVVATVTVPVPEPAGAVVALVADVVAAVEAVAMVILLGIISGSCPDTTWP